MSGKSDHKSYLSITLCDLSSDFNLLQHILPDPCTCITWHSQISSRRKCHTSDLRSIRQTGTLELLGKKSPVENVFSHFRIVSLSYSPSKVMQARRRSFRRNIQNEAYNTGRNHAVHKVLPDLLSSGRSSPSFGGRSRAYRRIQNIQKYFFKLHLLQVSA